MMKYGQLALHRLMPTMTQNNVVAALFGNQLKLLLLLKLIENFSHFHLSDESATENGGEKNKKSFYFQKKIKLTMTILFLSTTRALFGSLQLSLASWP